MQTASECLKKLLVTHVHQNKMAAALGFTPVSVSRYLNGEREPDADAAYRIASVTNTELTRKNGRWYFRRKYRTSQAS